MASFIENLLMRLMDATVIVHFFASIWLIVYVVLVFRNHSDLDWLRQTRRTWAGICVLIIACVSIFILWLSVINQNAWDTDKYLHVWAVTGMGYMVFGIVVDQLIMRTKRKQGY